MDKLNQPHDKYFRSTFGQVSFAKDFLSNYLPEELVDMIDMNTLESQPTSYISEELKEQFTDLLFRVNIMNKEAYVYFLFEHKSYRDRMVIFQVLKYISLETAQSQAPLLGYQVPSQTKAYKSAQSPAPLLGYQVPSQTKA